MESKQMDVVVDGLVYQFQSHGGISRIFSEILPRMCNLDDSLQVTLLTSGRCQQPLPTHAQLKHQPLLPVDQLFRPAKIWWRIKPYVTAAMQQMWLRAGKKRIWHSTYYTMLKQWHGPRVVTVYDLIHELFSHKFAGATSELKVKAQKRRCVLAADAIICLSEATKQDLQEIYNPQQAHIQAIHLAHSHTFRLLENDASLQKRPTPKPFLLYVGHRTYYKNFNVLLQAYYCWPKAKEIDLVVVGGPWLEAERQQLSTSNLAHNIHLLSNIDDEYLCFLYNQAIGFVYPSLYEGFGIPLLEAMACGCPVVASKIPATIEVAGDDPIYFEPTQMESLLAALDTLVTEGRNSARVQSGFERARQYSWDKTAQQTLAIYHALQS